MVVTGLSCHILRRQHRQQGETAQMSDLSLGLFKGRQRGNWVRLRTIIVLRWVAIAGQIGAIIVAQALYDLQLDLGLCLLVIGTAVIANLIAMVIFPETKRLSETENLLMVLFDLIQLGLLLFLSGGLHNPFSVLLLGPVMVSATVLTARSTIMLGLTAIVLATVLTRIYLPLQTEQGLILRVPDLFLFGNWVAIMIAVVFLSLYARRVAVEMHAMSDALEATQMALLREQKLTDIGGVVASTAHELGTPLATITLAAAELVEELSDWPELQDDARLIRAQADRCRDILRSMGQVGKDDLHLRQAPLMAVVREAAEPHMARGKKVLIDNGPAIDHGLPHPTVMRSPEIIHGLRNLIQNAVDFAADRVWVDCEWDYARIIVRIMDDGQGYPAHMIGRIGDPFVGRRRSLPSSITAPAAGAAEGAQRPGYEGMGLGLFIAKTLLERTGAELSFANGADPFLPPLEQPERCGAIVEVVWPRARIDAANRAAAALGENRPLLI